MGKLEKHVGITCDDEIKSVIIDIVYDTTIAPPVDLIVRLENTDTVHKENLLKRFALVVFAFSHKIRQESNISLQ